MSLDWCNRFSSRLWKSTNETLNKVNITYLTDLIYINHFWLWSQHYFPIRVLTPLTARRRRSRRTTGGCRRSRGSWWISGGIWRPTCGTPPSSDSWTPCLTWDPPLCPHKTWPKLVVEDRGLGGKLRVGVQGELRAGVQGEVEVRVQGQGSRREVRREVSREVQVDWSRFMGRVKRLQCRNKGWELKGKILRMRVQGFEVQGVSGFKGKET